MNEESKTKGNEVSKTQGNPENKTKDRVFKTGTVAYKIEKPFYDLIDQYANNKKNLDEIIQSKNKQSLQNESPEAKDFVELEAEINLKLKNMELEFNNYMRSYLKKYKEDAEDYNEIYFPPKRTPSQLVEILANICKEFDIFYEMRGGINKRTISVYKTKMVPRVSKEDPLEETKKDFSEIQEKIVKKKINSTEILPVSSENIDNEYKFIPDPVTNFKIKYVKENEVSFNCDIPEDNGDKIFEYLLYGPEKNLIKKSEKNEFSLCFSKDFPQCAKHLGYDRFLLSFAITARNNIGESKITHNFNLLVNGFKKYDFLICGKEVPVDDDKIVSLSEFSVFYKDQFKNLVNRLDMNNCSLILLDEGIVAQWGYSIDSNAIEIDLKDYSELIEEMISCPFFPLKNNGNHILISSITCGTNFCAVLTMKGEIYTWGMNNYGQLGHGDFKARPYGTKIKALSKEFCIDIASGLCHCLALTQKGQIYSWGYRQAEEGVPVLDRFKNVIDFENLSIHQINPRLMKSVIDEKIKRVFCGGYHNIALSENDNIYSWGDNESGQLGFEINPEIRPVLNSVTPKKMEIFKTKEIIKISCGESHTIVITKDKVNDEEELWSWGNSKYGQCGLGTFENKLIPMKIKKVWKGDTESVSCGKNHSLFLTKEKEVYGCGLTNNGALGKLAGIDKKVNTPVMLKIGGIKGEICDVAAGNDVSAILFK